MKVMIIRLLKKLKNLYLSVYRQYGSTHEKYFIIKPTLREPTSKLAVVMHIYYLDNLPLFKAKLNNLTAIHDIFITLPVDKQSYTEQLLTVFPDATILVVPNRGRDVLPFVKTANILKKLGYTTVLKFHSKKSTHRSDGQDWLESMLAYLLPQNPAIMEAICEKINQPDTGIIGPRGVYYPLTINFPANGLHMTNVVRRLYGKGIAHESLQLSRNDYGFFGGTMFWARIDAISPLLIFSKYDFEVESGQIDGTFAHALERLFCLIPELEHKDIYEVSSDAINMRTYASNNIPEWSKDHEK